MSSVRLFSSCWKGATVEVSRLDLASELRLRRWARLNYVSPDRRPASWHPVVLAEMRCRDVELADMEPAPAAARYVPLVPTLPVPPELNLGPSRNPLEFA
jgi:hypothetical protein